MQGDRGGNKPFSRQYMGALAAAFVLGGIGFTAGITDTSAVNPLANALFGLFLFAGPTFLVGWLITLPFARRARRTLAPSSTLAGSGLDPRSTGVDVRRDGIFISYRRQDEPNFAGRLADRLSNTFGKDNVFIDVDSIGPGVDFEAELERSLSRCKVLIAIIGTEWLRANADGQHRINDRSDYVHIEIARALSRGIRIIPIRVEGASMPDRSALHPSLAPLATRNAMDMSHARFNIDYPTLVATLKSIMPPTDTRFDG